MANNGNGGLIANIMGPGLTGFLGDAITEGLDIPYLDDPAQIPVMGGPGVSNFEFWGYTGAAALGLVGLLSMVTKKPVLGFSKEALVQGISLGAGIKLYESWGAGVLGLREPV